MMQYVDFSNVFLNNKNIFQKLPNKLGNGARHLMNLVAKRTLLLTILLGAENEIPIYQLESPCRRKNVNRCWARAVYTGYVMFIILINGIFIRDADVYNCTVVSICVLHNYQLQATSY